jgi:hypothetical protein
MDFSIPISPEVLALVVKILAFTQVLKRLTESSWGAWLLAKFGGGAEVSAIAAVAISILVGILAGVLQYAPDGITLQEVVTIFTSIIGANGVFALGKSMVPKVDFINITSSKREGGGK